MPTWGEILTELKQTEEKACLRIKQNHYGQTFIHNVSLKIAAKLADHKEFKSHGRHINRDKAKEEIGLIIDDLEEDQEFQDFILSVFHATTHTFNGTNAVRL